MDIRTLKQYSICFNVSGLSMQDPRLHPARPEGAEGREQERTAGATHDDDHTVEVPPPAHAADRQPPQAPEQIGPYRILECIGEGGMGVVYKAEQHTPRRIVSLKVVKLGMDSKQVVARFEAERQALGMLSHPNVAKVLDGGMTDRGRPYFAMEYVPGIPLTLYCQRNNLSIRARLALFIPVCHAIQHAHQKGIIHRDLKPSNILVQMSDGQPVPKVIDFGIAKATNATLTELTLHTVTGAMLGTPEYMSPEQAQTSGLDVDTRTDIYALGVILYELLTGMLPFDSKTLREAGPEGMVRIIRESDPPKPSTRLSVLPAGAPGSGDASATARHHAKALRREISGDLDWITLKAMEKDRTRRYETALGLALDLRRHLDLQPVIARPPTPGYKLGKFLRRHKRGVVAASLVVLALLLGIIGTTIGLVQARHAADHARALESKAKQEAEKAIALSRFMEGILESASPGAAGGRAVTVVDLLDRAASDMREKLKGQPEVEMKARLALARTYVGLGFDKPAEENARRAAELAIATFGESSPAALEVAVLRSHILRKTGATDDALLLARRTADTALQVLGRRHPITREAANNLAVILSLKDDHERAIAIQRELLDDVRQNPDGTPRARAGAYANNLGLFIQHQYQASRDPGLLAEAEALFREAVSDVQADDVSPANVAVLKENLAKCLREEGKLESAAVLTREAVAYARDKLGDSHPVTIQILRTHAEMLEAGGQYPQALAARQAELKEAKAVSPPANQWIAATLEQIARLQLRLGRFADAAAAYNARADLDPTDHFKWFECAVLLALGGDENAYRLRARGMLDAFAEQTAPEIKERVAKVNLLLAGLPDVQIAQCQSLIDAAMKEETRPGYLNWYYTTKGIAEYRAGRHAAAVGWLTRARAGEFGPYSRCQADFFLAMARHGLEQEDEAQAAFRAASATLDADTSANGAPTLSAANLIDWAYAQVARKEAQQTLKSPR
jgi:serine/threonine protein kinase/tetratricopeptide (TPR) repeat protein